MITARLVIREGGGEAREVDLGDEETLGRGAPNSIRFEDASVSRQQATISRVGDDRYLVADLGSANGSFLNGRRLIAPARLSGGDTLSFGRVTITFVQDDGAAGDESGQQRGDWTSVGTPERTGVLLGSSPPMMRVFELIETAGQSTISVLVEGETGTGKELVARAIHESSGRSGGPFVAINCAAIPENLLESELFGHRRGAFTGAARDRPGLFAQADGGTVFLDEIGEMSPALQPKLLRVLQDGAVTMIGDATARKVDFRLIAATNIDLLRAVEQGTFRRDLYHRIAAFPIRIPPLRERREDIRELAPMLLNLAGRQQGKRLRGIAQGAMEVLLRCDWLGNVRELQNEIERAVAFMETGQSLGVEHLSERIVGGWRGHVDTPSAPSGESSVDVPYEAAPGSDLRSRTDAFERQEIVAALARNDGNKSRAATDMGLTYQGLLKKMRRLGMLD